MKIEISFLAGFFLIGTDLSVRVAAHGLEQMLFSMAIEYGLNALRAGRKHLPNAMRLRW